jgi:hypothetical protein
MSIIIIIKMCSHTRCRIQLKIVRFVIRLFPQSTKKEYLYENHTCPSIRPSVTY